MTNSGVDNTYTTSLGKGPATVSSSSSLEDVDSLSLLPPAADPLSVLPFSNNFEPSPASISPAPSPPAASEQDTANSFATNPLTRTFTAAPPPSIVLHTVPVPIMPSLPSAVSQTASPAPVANSNTVAEFLYQLTKMLTDDNREVIEWTNGKIEVHDPHRLASDVLHKYFRHSKFASFQRQLNYFGFKKLAGKGKMAPCSYVNDATTSDLRSLLLIKRKTSASTSRDKSGGKRERSDSNAGVPPAGTSGSEIATTAVNPVLAGILHQNISPPVKRQYVNPSNVARIAVGKGVKHQLNGYLKHPATQSISATVGKGIRHGYSPCTPSAHTPLQGNATAALKKTELSFPDPPHLAGDVQSSLSELTNNYRNSLGVASSSSSAKYGPEGNLTTEELGAPLVLGMLSRDSSLVDLAMLPPVQSVDPTPVSELANSSMPFFDFPQSLDVNKRGDEPS